MKKKIIDYFKYLFLGIFAISIIALVGAVCFTFTLNTHEEIDFFINFMFSLYAVFGMLGLLFMIIEFIINKKWLKNTLITQTIFM